MNHGQSFTKSFIGKASVGAVAAGALVAIPGYELGGEAAHASAEDAKHHSGPVLAHLRNAETGEIAILVGTHEVVIHDRVLAQRLLQAALYLAASSQNHPSQVFSIHPQRKGASMSSHREAPGLLDDPVADSTDLYAFVSPDQPIP